MVPGGPPHVPAPFASLATGADQNHHHTNGVGGAHQSLHLRDSTAGSALKSGFSAFGLGNQPPPGSNLNNRLAMIQSNNSQLEAQQSQGGFKIEFNYIHFRYKIVPRIFYFIVQFSFIIPLIYLNREEIVSDSSNLTFLIAFVVISLLTYAQYLRTALADPGIINSMNFNKAY